jgi:molecular chaperone Hsp33
MPQRDGDTLNRFIFEDTNVRGEVVHLDATWHAVLERHRYPPVVRDLLGEALAAAALLVTTIKSSSSLTLQIQGDGPVNMIVVQADANQTLRGLARWKGPVVAGPLRQQVGSARLAITLDPGEGREHYQGIVGLEAEDSLAEALETYFQRSEQLDTRLWLAANDQRAAGMLIQALPDTLADSGAWERTVHLGATVTDAELLELPHRELLRRLFHDEDVRVFNARPISFRCSCSRERIELMLRGLGYDEVRQIVDEEGEVAVTCEFCNQRYVFDPVDVEQLFAACDQPRVPPTRH